MKTKTCLKILTALFMLTFLFGQGGECVNADGEPEQYYARVKDDGVFFYSLPADIKENQVFEVPKTYFVLLTGTVNSQFYSCKYDDMDGFVRKSDISPCEGTPHSPYLEDGIAYNRLVVDQPMYFTPYKDDKSPFFLSELASTKYIGRAYGDELVENDLDLWYYCEIETEIGPTKGYFYAPYICNITKSDNMEEDLPPVVGEIFKSQVASVTAKPLSSTAKTLIILSVSLPCLLLIYFLVKPTLINVNKEKKVKAHKPRRKKDYYEFDENDLS